MEDRLKELIFSNNPDDRVLGITLAYHELGESFLAELLPENLFTISSKIPLTGDYKYIIMEKGWVAMLNWIYEYREFMDELHRKHLIENTSNRNIIL